MTSLNFDDALLESEVEAGLRNLAVVEQEEQEDEDEDEGDGEEGLEEISGENGRARGQGVGQDDDSEGPNADDQDEMEAEEIWRPHTVPTKPSHPMKQLSPSQETSLRHELETLTRLNAVLESTHRGLTRGKAGLDRFEKSTDQTNALLDVYIKILSQAEWTQRLILDSQWAGASNDIEALEEEARIAQERAERSREAQATERARKEALSSQSSNVPARQVSSKTDHGRAKGKPVNGNGSGAAPGTTRAASGGTAGNAGRTVSTGGGGGGGGGGARSKTVRSSGYGHQGRTPTR